jgi:hypothetical protein
MSQVYVAGLEANVARREFVVGHKVDALVAAREKGRDGEGIGVAVQGKVRERDAPEWVHFGVWSVRAIVELR